MKILILFSLIIFSSLHTLAQKIKLKPSVAIAGIITETYLKDVPSYRENWFLPELSIGSFVETRINKRFYFETGCFYSVKSGYFERGYFIFSPIPEPPFAKERYNVHFLKLPVNFLFKMNNKGKHQIWGIGPVVKYSFAAGRKITVEEQNLSYKNNFRVDKENGNRIGLASSLFLGKEVYKVKHPFSLRIGLDVDITELRHPTDFEREELHYFTFREYNVSVLFSYLLGGGKK